MTDSVNDEKALPPPVLWAQRKTMIYLKVALEDCKSPVIKLEKDKLFFQGKGGTDNNNYEITLEFFKEIKPEDSKFVVRDRGTEFVLFKAEDGGGYWKRLLKEDKKYHWLKVDFNKWRDEDDSEDDMEGGGGGGTDFEEMMRKMGGLGGSNNLDELENEQDSDDEGLPDLE